MARAPKVCSHHRCPNVQPCPIHQRKPWQGSTRKAQLPSSGRWERIRRRILDRDPVCRVCDNALSVEVDHIGSPVDHDDTNLQGVCVRCHRAKTQAEAAESRRT